MYGLVGLVVNLAVVLSLVLAKRMLTRETDDANPYPTIKYETKPLVPGVKSDAIVDIGVSVEDGEEEEVGEEREEE